MTTDTLHPSGQSRKWWLLAAMGLIGGLVLLDETILGVALPTIRHDLGLRDTTAHWIVNAYLLVFAGFAAAGGKACDLIGLRKALLISGIAFLAAAVLAGMANDAALLIAARTIQGFAAALLFPITVVSISNAFPKEQRGMAIGVLAGIACGFLAAGPLLGGLFTDYVSWRWIFWINIPILLTALAISYTALDDVPKRGTSPSLDLFGLVLLITGLTSFVFALMEGSEFGWTSPIILSTLAGGCVLLAGFIRFEARVAEPLVDVALFRYPAVAAGNMVMFIAQYSKFSVAIFAALYLQYELKLPPFYAGLGVFIAVLPAPFCAVLSGRIADKFGSRPLILAGLAVATAVIFSVAFAMQRHSLYMLVALLPLWCIAVQFCFVPSTRILVNSVPEEKQGEVSGVAITFRLLGGTLSMTIGTAIHTTFGSFPAVFYATAGGMLVILAYAFRYSDRRGE